MRVFGDEAQGELRGRNGKVSKQAVRMLASVLAAAVVFDDQPLCVEEQPSPRQECSQPTGRQTDRQAGEQPFLFGRQASSQPASQPAALNAYGMLAAPSLCAHGTLAALYRFFNHDMFLFFGS